MAEILPKANSLIWCFADGGGERHHSRPLDHSVSPSCSACICIAFVYPLTLGFFLCVHQETQFLATFQRRHKITDPFIAATCWFASPLTWKGDINAYLASGLVPDLWNTDSNRSGVVLIDFYFSQLETQLANQNFVREINNGDVIILYSKIATYLHPCTECWINRIKNSWICIFPPPGNHSFCVDGKKWICHSLLIF